MSRMFFLWLEMMRHVGRDKDAIGVEVDRSFRVDGSIGMMVFIDEVEFPVDQFGLPDAINLPICPVALVLFVVVMS